MSKDRRKQAIAESLKLLASTHVQAMRQLEATLTVLSQELDLQETSWLESLLAPATARTPPSAQPIADRTTLSVVYQGKTCFLGNTLLFRFFEVLSRRPNRLFSHAELLDEVWGGLRTDASIRHVAKRLRDRLAAVGLRDLAEAVNGSTPGYYVLRLPTDG
jgi:DNA-binding response OmpR family regulator